MMNNITRDGEICSNNNNNNIPSMVSFVGLECNNQKQFGDWETNTSTHHTPNTHNNNNANPNFINPTTNNIFDHFNYNTHSSSSSSFHNTSNFIPNYSQFPDYPSSNFFKKQHDEVFHHHHHHHDGGLYYNNNSSSSDRGIGLNLGHRTYFSSRESTMMDRLIRRPRGFYLENQVPRCQAEGCMIDLTNAKHYHRRHKVCEFHSKATKVVAGGLEQRFCQQCSRFHVLAEFDEAKRSCRKRLADHNRRRRKPHQPGPSDCSLLPPAKTSENALQVGSSSSASARSEEVVQETSLSSSTLSLMISKCTTNNKPVCTSNTNTSTTHAKDEDTLMMPHFNSITSSPSNCGPISSPSPSLSLAGHHDQLLIRSSCNTTSTNTDHHQSRPFVITTANHHDSSTSSNNLFIHRDMMSNTTTSITVSSPYHHHQNFFFSSNVNDHQQANLQSTTTTTTTTTGDGDGSTSVDNRNNQLHHQAEDLHNLLHLRQAMFDVEFV